MGLGFSINCPPEQVRKEGKKEGEGKRERKPAELGVVPQGEPQWQVSGTQEGVQPSLVAAKRQMLGRERPSLVQRGFLTSPAS